MSHPVIDSQEHEKIMAMLPWYVNRTLELSDRQIVSDHLDQCEECQSEVDFLNTMNQVVEDDADVSYRAHADVDKSLANVMQRIDAEEAQISSKTPKSSLLLHKLNQLFFLPGNLSVPQWGATAIAGILVAVLGVWLYSNDAANDYSVLSSADISDSSLQLSVRFYGPFCGDIL